MLILMSRIYVKRAGMNGWVPSKCRHLKFSQSIKLGCHRSRARYLFVSMVMGISTADARALFSVKRKRRIQKTGHKTIAAYAF